MPKSNKLTVIQEPENPIERNILARALVDISKAISELKRGGLTFEAVVVLTRHNLPSKHKLTLSDVSAVLHSLEDLKRQFTA